MKVLLSSAYMAPVEYYAWMIRADEVLVEQHDHYMKQTYRNRCTICAADGPLTLTVPIVKPQTEKCPMRDIQISDHGNWRHLHWNALRSAYKMSPFWDYYEDDFRPFYDQKWKFLMDYNEALQEKVCELLDIQPKVTRTNTFLSPTAPEIWDLREKIHPKRKRPEEDPFQLRPYYQVFQHRLGFQPNLSIVDLLMNMGPEGLLIIKG